MSQMNPKVFVLNTAYSVKIPYIAGLPLCFGIGFYKILYQIDKIWYQIDKILYQIDKIWYQIDKIWYQIDKVWYQIDKIWYQIDKILSNLTIIKYSKCKKLSSL